MSALTLSLKAPPRQRVDLSPLLPERLSGLDTGAIARIELASGNRGVPVGDLFAVAAGDPAELRLEGGCDRLDYIGRDMTAGRIVVEGDAGAYLGLAMTGGALRVRGTVGAWAGAEMRGGEIEIDGAAGDFLGGALPGSMRGMGGGLVVLRGPAGDRAGDRMRRGVIVVEGALGAYAGSRMIAGTLAACGPTVGPYPGFAMTRGSLLLCAAPQRLLPTFADCGGHDLGFLRLLGRALAGRCRGLAWLEDGPRVRRLAGDAAAGGKGEILIREG